MGNWIIIRGVGGKREKEKESRRKNGGVIENFRWGEENGAAGGKQGNADAKACHAVYGGPVFSLRKF
jgi:hypothetical protein